MNPHAWIEALLGLVYPNVCQICKKLPAFRSGGYVCEACQAGPDGVQWIRPPYCACCGLPFEGEITVEFQCANCHGAQMHFRSARAAVEFSGVVRETIHGYKYNHAIWFETFLVNLLRTGAVPALVAGDWDCLVPIPLHWRKRLSRSFNQAHRLATALSRETDIPVKPLLRRVRHTAVQAHLARAARAENVKRAFRFCGDQRLQGDKIVLVDDVLTTGATAAACAKVLMENGAGAVDVWTVARHVLKQ